MLSPRNHDQVVFVKPGEGLQPEWTLGADDNHQILFEQHNPDYIPEDRGGPAVLVADSKNNRVNGSWEQSWVWADSKLQWPRDADRLPNGHTLITDSNGTRVIVVAKNGSIVWQTTIGLPYEAEQFPGDESTGPSARSANLTSLAPTSEDAAGNEQANNSPNIPIYGRIARAILGHLPGTLENGLLFIFPSWVGPVQIVSALGCVGTIIMWFAIEARHGIIQLRSPIRLVR